MRTIFLILLPLVLTPQTTHIYIDTAHNSKPMKLFSKSLFDNWNSLSVPVDLSQLSNFEGSKCLISMDNFLNSPLIKIMFPVIIRNPIIAAYKDEDYTMSFLGWVPEQMPVSLNQINNSEAIAKPEVLNRLIDGRCLSINLGKLILNSRVWKCQLRVDLFPPYLESPKLPTMFEYMSGFYEGAQFWRIALPSLWEINFSEYSETVLPGRIPALHMRFVPMEQVKSSLEMIEAVNMWMDDTQYSEYYCTANVDFLMVNLVRNNQHEYVPKNIHYIDRQQQNKIIEVEVKT